MNLQPLTLRRGDEVRRAVFTLVSESDLSDDEAAPQLLLSANELAQLERMQFAQKRQSFLLGRLAAKRALRSVLDETNLSAIEIQPGVFGQPLIVHPRAHGLDVTLSHSHGLAVALAFPAAWPIGIDLETVAHDVAATLLTEMNLSDAERRWYAATANPASACGVLWSAREALGKAMKSGVNSPLGVLSACDIEPAPCRPGATAWCGGYTNFSQFRWRAQISGETVLTLTVPRDVTLEQWPQL